MAEPTYITEAKAKHAAAIDKYRDMLHPDDLLSEPANFSGWIRSCDVVGRESLLGRITMTMTAIEGARPSYDSNPKSACYVDVRTPYLEYAEQALARRFPDPNPYDQSERAYIAHIQSHVANHASRGGK